MKQKRYLLILFYILLIFLPFTLYVKSNSAMGIDFKYILPAFFGITAYTLFTFQLLLVSKNKFLDKHFGLDKLYRFHMVIAVIAIVFSYLHKVLKEQLYSESFKTQLGDIAFVLFISVAIFSILMMVNKLFFKISLVDNAKKFLNNTLKIKYEYKVLIHNIMVIALVVLLVHILLAFSVKSNLALNLTLILYFAVPFIFYIHSKIIKLYFNNKNKYEVSEVIEEADNITTLKFKPKFGKIFDYMPGQFLFVRIHNPEVPGDEHPFTISSSPTEEGFVAVTVKQLGDFSNKVNRTKVGDNAYINGGYGTFSYLRDAESNKLCFIAGGIGITPFLGMLRYISAKDRDKPVKLLWGVRDESEIICKEEFKTFSTTLTDFEFIPVLSKSPAYKGEKGYIDGDKIRKYVTELADYDFYICGPPIMLTSQIKNLKALGVPNKRIHFERFSL